MTATTGNLILAEHSRTTYAILAADDATPVERKAATELAAYLEKIIGAAFPVVTAAPGGQAVIAVGPGAALAAGLPPVRLEGLGNEGALRCTLGRHLVLTGGPGAARGTLYAVYTFLEEQLGCRWWTPEAEHVPRQATLSLPAFDLRYLPPFDYRECLCGDTYDVSWAARNRTNAFWGLTEEWGGCNVYEGWCHTFYSLVPPDPYFTTHPEWYSEVDGRRTCEHAQLCLANPELTAFVIEELKRRLRASSPPARYASVSQNDCLGYCQCADCRALDDREGGPAGSLIHFCNAVAEGIEEEFPRVKVETLAYMYSRKPPAHLKPRHNVSIRLCSYECDFLHSFEHPNNRPFREDVQAWARVSDNLYVWDYVTNFENYVQPHPNWYTLGENVRFFLRNNVRGVFEQANNCSRGGEMSFLRAWVLAKLLWNPSLDAAALIDEFLRGYFGPAAAHVDAYMRLVHGAASAVEFYPGSYLIQRCFARRGLENPTREGLYLDLGATWDAPFLAADVILKALRLFADAERAAGDDPVLRNRVEVARLPVLFVALVRWPDIREHAHTTGHPWPLPENRRAACRLFTTVARRNSITLLKEGGSRNLPWLRKISRRKTTVQP